MKIGGVWKSSNSDTLKSSSNMFQSLFLVTPNQVAAIRGRHDNDSKKMGKLANSI